MKRDYNMKHTWVRILLVLQCFLLAAPLSANLLDNPGFEQDFQSWNDWGNSFIETTSVHSGAKAARIGTTQGGRAQQVFGLVPGTQYTMCAWSRVDAVTNLSWMGVNVYDAAVTLIDNHQWTVAWTTWQQNSVTFTYPANGNYVDVWVWTDTTTAPTFVDDFTLVAGATCAGGNAPPSAAFSTSTSGLEATFSDASTDGDGSVVAWSWDFGDGNVSSAQHPVHLYAAAGTYSVQLTVTDNEGATGNTSQNVTVPASTAAANFPFPQHVDYAPGTISPDHRSQAQMDNDVRAFYDYWKANFLVSAGTSSGGKPMYRVTFGSGNPGSTVSEGMGFGMIIVATMAGYDPLAKDYFDGLWEFVKEHPSSGDPRLMDWQVPEASGDSSAFDGDADIAYGLLLADAQWGSAGAVNYAADAANLIAGIKDSTIGPASFLPMLGDWVNPAGSPHNQYTPRSSDFMPGHFRAYGRATGDTSWDQVVTNVQAVIDSIQANHSPVTGLLPDFIVDADTTPQPAPPGFLEGANDGHYNYNAGRDPWRLGADALLNNDATSMAQARKIANWINSSTGGNPANIQAGYQLNGTPLDSYFTTFFAAPFGVAAMTEPALQPFLNATYDAVYNTQEDYYSDSVNLLSLLVMSNNFWDPTTIADNGLEVISWVPVYAIPQAQAAAQADFGACDAADGLSRIGLQFWTPNNDGT
ncbi:MAG: PKD domain-containing protein, partial [Xanthomonadales bacterium]|nr:PKD domain-containing protein [Xanthomonadales bacterium]